MLFWVPLKAFFRVPLKGPFRVALDVIDFMGAHDGGFRGVAPIGASGAADERKVVKSNGF